ncbi:MAG: pyridoxamine 5'-phosphate oxidase [Phycisphaerae bacterium]|nr:pyridoxamine 5'-phosphate oxidase [Phycisphaerae bacterium]
MSLLAQVMAMLGGPGLPERLPSEPFQLLCEWFDHAQRLKTVPNPNAMVLATSTLDGRPSARVVLCKELRADLGAVVFYTNFESRKAHELESNPHAAVVFHFDSSGHQARVEGVVERLSDEDANAYFASRAMLSKLGAWASRQSQPIGSRVELAQRVIDAMHALRISPMTVLAAAVGGEPIAIPRPPHWGGYRLVARRVELWTSAHGRLHDRAEWTRPANGNLWSAQRLQP